MGLSQDVNNQKKELGEMVLRVGESYEINGVTITQGTVTEQQQQWWEQNKDTPVDERSYIPLNQEQTSYLEKSDGQGKAVTRPSFVGANFGNLLKRKLDSVVTRFLPT